MDDIFQSFRLILLSVSLLLVNGEQCLFGPSCIIPCNCADDGACDPLGGVCPGGCSSGWDGPSCQRRNVALGRPTTQSSTYRSRIASTSDKAVDGIVGHGVFYTPCTLTEIGESDPFWTVALNKTYSIYRFQIYNRADRACIHTPCGAGLNGFILSVGNSSENYRVCYRDNTTSASGPGDIITGVCINNRPVSGDRIKITVPPPNPVTLCEVQIFVCNPGTYGTQCSQTCGFCADGRTVCDAISGDCPQVDPRCLGGYSGSKCDECGAGMYGTDCTPCGFCAEGTTVCDTSSGNCPARPGLPRCMAGYRGVQCKTACSGGSYGSHCEDRCGQCVDGNLTCDHVTGACPNCAAGWQGERCTQLCSQGTWGPSCKLTCSPNCVQGQTGCDITTGVCFEGCREPYQGTHCQQDERGNSVNIGIIAGSISGAVLASVLVTAAILLWRRRLATPNSPNPADQGHGHGQGHGQGHGGPQDDSRPDPATYDDAAADDENTYEAVFENDYNKIRLSKLEQDTKYATLR